MPRASSVEVPNMRQARLNDAAIALSKVLVANEVKHGIFGGCAVAALGGPCEAKDVDCLVASDKPQMMNLFGGEDSICPIGEDFVFFRWDSESDDPVLVELSLVSPSAMQSVVPRELRVRGESTGEGSTYILDEVCIFKGKLRAAAVRSKESDLADLAYLESTFHDKLWMSASQFNQHYVGLAVRRYPKLAEVFQRVGVDVVAAANGVKGVSLDDLWRPQPGDVQRSLLG
ncbi:MAG: hypothetical protein M1840_000523 [Geoglossum simile]|nr:MAG: hypothetical protein M1840_000523 [Geoglossum simile]